MPAGTEAPLLLVERIDGVIVVNIAKAALTAEDVITNLEDQLKALVEHAGPAKLLLSFRNVRFMSSAVLGILLRLSRKMGDLGGTIRICSVAPALMEVFRAAGLDRRFAIEENESSALDLF